MEQSVSALFARYLTCSQLTESSVAIKQRALEHFLFLCGDRNVGDISYELGEDYRNGLYNTLSVMGREPAKVRQSVNIYLTNFKAFVSWLAKRHLIQFHVWREVRAFTVDEARVRPYTAAEIARILRIADTRWRAMVLLGLMSMRRAEILNLVVRDIHFDRNYIQIAPKKDTATTWRWSIKNHQQALVPLAPVIETIDETIDLHALLIELIEWLPERQPYVFLRPDTYKTLWDKKQKGELTWQERNNPWGNFSRDFRNLLGRAAVELRRFHDLRATFATKMGETLPLRKIQRLMRHSSPQTTARYIHVDEQKLVAESAKLCEKCYA